VILILCVKKSTFALGILGCHAHAGERFDCRNCRLIQSATKKKKRNSVGKERSEPRLAEVGDIHFNWQSKSVALIRVKQCSRILARLATLSLTGNEEIAAKH